jgi:hypothetical protein
MLSTCGAGWGIPPLEAAEAVAAAFATAADALAAAAAWFPAAAAYTRM